MKTIEQKIFELCHELGEQTFNNMHLTQPSHYNCSIDCYLQEYRIYHSSGHCIDVSKSAIKGENKTLNGYQYTVSQKWYGFIEMPLNDLLQELNYKKELIRIISGDY